MKKVHKEIARYILLTVLTVIMYGLLQEARDLVMKSKLTTEYAGIVSVYLGVWGYVIKSFFTSTVSEDKGIDNDF